MRAILQVQNLKCNGCANTITTKLSHIDNISAISIEVETSEIAFDYDSESTLLHAKEALKNAGYPEINEDNPLFTKAKSYVSCAIGKVG
ncbi:MAG: hypothetical protein RL494_1719 [Bacteroidota bacterium]|jgi:copper chaperone CopZ